MRKDILLPGLAVAGGLLGLGLRRWQWAAGYNPETQLFLHHHPSNFLLPALTAALVLAFLLLLRTASGKSLPGDSAAAFHCPAPGYMTLSAAAAFLFLGAGVLGLLEGMGQLALWRAAPETHLLTYPGALLLCAVLCFAAGPAVLLVAKGGYRGDLSPSCSLLAVFPPLAGLAWLFATHLDHGTDPVLMSYGFFLSAIALLMLAHYDMAAFFHGRPHPRRTVFCALLGTSLGLFSLGDGLTPFQLTLTAGFILSALAGAYALLRNSFGPPWPKRQSGQRSSSEPQSPEHPGDQTA